MKKFQWLVRGDIDGFFGLMLDNLLQLLVLVTLCTFICGIPPAFILSIILPGAGISLLVGNFYYAYQAKKLSEEENRDDVTALPYGLNTVSMFAFIFFVIAPVYRNTNDYKLAWKIGLLACFVSGIIEFFGSFVAEKIRKITPRAALLSALSGIAITFISMEFFVKTYRTPLISFIPFAIILIQYFGKYSFPFKIPGGLLSVATGTILAWLSYSWGEPMMKSEEITKSFSDIGFYLPTLTLSELISVFTFQNLKDYASVIIPMGIFNVIGSLQNIESAEASGDKFDTKNSLLVNGAGSILGSLFGSPFPTTIYIGHPGWKALGARAGYSMLNGFFMTLLCFLGLMSFVKALIPIEAGMAIILWIGIVMGAQAFNSTPKEHAPAVVLGLFPAMAAWGAMLIQGAFRFADGSLKQILSNSKLEINQAHIILQSIPADLEFLPYSLAGLFSLSQGFLLVSMIWASICVHVIDKNFIKAGNWSLASAAVSSVGLIHSFKFIGNDVVSVYNFPTNKNFIIAYFLLAVLFYICSLKKGNEI